MAQHSLNKPAGPELRGSTDACFQRDELLQPDDHVHRRACDHERILPFRNGYGQCLLSVSVQLCRTDDPGGPSGRPIWTSAGADVHGFGIRPIHRADSTGWQARFGHHSRNCAFVPHHALGDGHLYCAPLPIMCASKRQLVCHWGEGARLGIGCGRGWDRGCGFASAVFLDDWTLRMAWILLGCRRGNWTAYSGLAVVCPGSSRTTSLYYQRSHDFPGSPQWLTRAGRR